MLRIVLRSILGVLVLLQVFVGDAVARSISFPELTDLLPGEMETTYADLFRLVMPSTAGSGTSFGDRATGIRHIEGGNDIMLGSGDVRDFAALPVRSGGLDRIALLFDMGEQEYVLGSAILALFDVSGEPTLLDTADVAFDRTTFFPDPAWLPVSPDEGLVMTRSTHHNSNQTYAITALILVRNDRLELVDTIFTFSERNCAYERTQELDVGKGQGEPFADIVATIIERTVVSGEECGDPVLPAPEPITITVVYHWDSIVRKYAPDSDAFVALARENEERF